MSLTVQGDANILHSVERKSSPLLHRGMQIYHKALGKLMSLTADIGGCKYLTQYRVKVKSLTVQGDANILDSLEENPCPLLYREMQLSYTAQGKTCVPNCIGGF